MPYLVLATFLMQNEKMKYHQEYLDSIRILEEKWKVNQKSPKKQVHIGSSFKNSIMESIEHHATFVGLGCNNTLTFSFVHSKCDFIFFLFLNVD
jgi:hypothetical protein